MNILHRTIAVLSLFISLTSSLSAQDVEGFDEMITELVKDKVTYITIEELQSKLDQDIYILDTREKNEYATSHIPNAVHVGYDNFKLKTVKDIPKDALIITYCSVGYRSGQIGEKLLNKGYTNVFNLKGGIFTWANHGLPIIDAKGEKTNDVHGYDKDWSKWVNAEKCNIKLD